MRSLEWNNREEELALGFPSSVLVNRLQTNAWVGVGVGVDYKGTAGANSISVFGELEGTHSH